MSREADATRRIAEQLLGGRERVVFVQLAAPSRSTILRYQQIEGSFTQPNGGVSRQMLGWRLRLGGPRETVVMACASGAASIAFGADLIRSGATPLALAGGVDAITRICFMGFNALKLLDPEPCRPFDRGRRGMSIGEAAAFVVLEDSEHCRRRGGRALGELLGAGVTTDAHHVTAPHPEGEGMIRAMTDALAAAGREPGDIGYVNAHGTGTPQNDRVEALAMARVFGEGRVLVSSTKSLVGHTMAAAGSVEARAIFGSMSIGAMAAGTVSVSIRYTPCGPPGERRRYTRVTNAGPDRLRESTGAQLDRPVL